MVKIVAEVDSHADVDKVEILGDGKVIETFTDPPYETDWGLAREAEGQHEIVVTAKDAHGHTGESKANIYVTAGPDRGLSSYGILAIVLVGGLARLGIVIADVVDKCRGAAMMMSLIRTLIRTYAADYPDQPARVMQMANQRLIADVDVGMFDALCYGTLDPISGRLIYSNAGHPPPYLFPSAPDSSVTALAATGIPLGVSEGRWEPGSLTIEPGELLFLYTDGVTDAMDQHGETLGIEQILEAIREARSLPAGQYRTTCWPGFMPTG